MWATGPVRQVAQAPLTNLTVVAIALAQQNGRRLVPVWEGFHIHDTWRDISTGGLAVQALKFRLHAYASDAFRHKFRVFSMRSQWWEAGSSV
jgi:hypothetical protein